MSNRLNSTRKIPALPEFVVAGGPSRVIAESRATSERVVAFGEAFADLFRGAWRLFCRLGDSIAQARAMRDLVNMDDRSLAHMGLRRADIPAIIARGGFDRGIEAAVARYLASLSDDRRTDKAA